MIKDIKSILDSELFCDSAEDMFPSRAVEYWSILDILEKSIKKRKEELRSVLIEHADTVGVDENGVKKASINQSAALLTSTTRLSDPNAEELLELLQTKNIQPTQAFDKIETLSYNPFKVRHLVEVGKISQEDVDNLRSKTTYLTVKKDPALEEEFNIRKSRKPR